jgi:hypothetical protein
MSANCAYTSRASSPTAASTIGITLSYYYKDLAGNRVEPHMDFFGDWVASAEWMRPSPEANAIGAFVQPAKIAAAAAAREPFETIHRHANGGELSPAPVAARLRAQEHPS